MQKSGQYFEFKSLRLLFVLKDTVIRPCWAQPPERSSSTGVSSACSLQEDTRDPAVTGSSTLMSLDTTSCLRQNEFYLGSKRMT